MKKKALRIILILICLIIAIALTLLSVNVYQRFTSAIEFSYPLLFGVIGSSSGVLIMIVLMAILGIKVIGEK